MYHKSDFSAKNKLKLATGYFKEELHNPGNLDRLYLSDKQEFHYVAFDEYHYTTRWNSKVEYLRKINDNNQLQTTFAYSYYNKTKKTLRR